MDALNERNIHFGFNASKPPSFHALTYLPSVRGDRQFRLAISRMRSLRRPLSRPSSTSGAIRLKREVAVSTAVINGCVIPFTPFLGVVFASWPDCIRGFRGTKGKLCADFVPAVDEQCHDKSEPAFALGLDSVEGFACGFYRHDFVSRLYVNRRQSLRDVGFGFLEFCFPSSDSRIVGMTSSRVRAAINDGLDHSRFIMFVGLNDIWKLSMQCFADSLATQAA